MTTPEQRLRQAVEDYAAAPEIAREKRNEAIRAAAAAGLKQVDIIRITHYSRETVRRALDPDVAARVKAAREAADAERAASAVTKPHPWPRGAVVVALDNREGTFTPSEPTELPDHQARKDLFEEHLTIEDYTAYVRAEREAHAAGTPKFALPEPLLPEALSLGVYIRARADRKL